MNGWTEKGRWIIDKWMKRTKMGGRKDGWVKRQMKGEKDGKKNRWLDAWVDRQTIMN